jgi:DNA-binding beta-propeller fold protein YncE
VRLPPGGRPHGGENRHLGSRVGGIIVLVLLTVLSGVIGGVGSLAAQVDMDSVEAQEELRWGVRAYHSARFNEAIRSFSRALSAEPENERARLWLGHAYFRSGLVDAALAEWQYVAERREEASYLSSVIERVRRERSIASILGEAERWVTTTELEGRSGERVLFHNPTSIRPRPDGSFYVVSFATDEILVMNPNGVVVRRVQGGVQGFVQPFDIVDAEGSLFVTEFGADRIAEVGPNGGRRNAFGATGIGDGNLLGPQYLAYDGDGTLYVTDWGNARVCKFTTEGEFVQCFGTRSSFFRGLQEPTGIVVRDERVYVADAAQRAVFVFDTSGNLLREIADVGLTHPEGMRAFDDEHLLLADRSRLVLLNIADELVSEFSDVVEYPGRVTAGAVDANQNLVASDVERDRLIFLSPLSEVYSGLTVHIRRVVADAFPEVFVDVSVEDARGNPVVGLEDENFLVTENRLAAEELQVAESPADSAASDVALVVDRSPRAGEYRRQLGESAGAVADALDSAASMQVVSTATEPSVMAGPGSSTAGITAAAESSSGIGASWSFDRGLRFAGTQLLESRNRRVVVYLSTGRLGAEAYRDYQLRELADFMVNNDIRFYPVYVTNEAVSRDLEFLAEETGGSSYYAYRPEGLGDMAREIETAPSGRYTLRILSRSDSDFGRGYIPIEVEAYLIQRSGRGELGYFGPTGQ